MIRTGYTSRISDEPVSIHRDSNGKVDGILVQTFDQAFVLSLKDGEELNWDDAMAKYKDVMLTKQQWLIVAAYEEKINELLEQVGGDTIRDKCYWSAVGCYSYYAWYYSGNGGTLYNRYKYSSLTVRPALAYSVS